MHSAHEASTRDYKPRCTTILLGVCGTVRQFTQPENYSEWILAFKKREVRKSRTVLILCEELEQMEL